MKLRLLFTSIKKQVAFPAFDRHTVLFLASQTEQIEQFETVRLHSSYGQSFNVLCGLSALYTVYALPLSGLT